jgi:hypothetical protein
LKLLEIPSSLSFASVASTLLSRMGLPYNAESNAGFTASHLFFMGDRFDLGGVSTLLDRFCCDGEPTLSLDAPPLPLLLPLSCRSMHCEMEFLRLSVSSLTHRRLSKAFFAFFLSSSFNSLRALFSSFLPSGLVNAADDALSEVGLTAEAADMNILSKSPLLRGFSSLRGLLGFLALSCSSSLLSTQLSSKSVLIAFLFVLLGDTLASGGVRSRSLSSSFENQSSNASTLDAVRFISIVCFVEAACGKGPIAAEAEDLYNVMPLVSKLNCL